MTRSALIAEIHATLEQLPDERLETLVELARAWARTTVYSTLSGTEKAKIDAALSELERGEGIPGSEVFAALRERVNAARANGAGDE